MNDNLFNFMNQSLTGLSNTHQDFLFCDDERSHFGSIISEEDEEDDDDIDDNSSMTSSSSTTPSSSSSSTSTSTTTATTVARTSIGAVGVPTMPLPSSSSAFFDRILPSISPSSLSPPSESEDEGFGCCTGKARDPRSTTTTAVPPCNRNNNNNNNNNIVINSNSSNNNNNNNGSNANDNNNKRRPSVIYASEEEDSPIDKFSSSWPSLPPFTMLPSIHEVGDQLSSSSTSSSSLSSVSSLIKNERESLSAFSLYPLSKPKTPPLPPPPSLSQSQQQQQQQLQQLPPPPPLPLPLSQQQQQQQQQQQMLVPPSFMINSQMQPQHQLQPLLAPRPIPLPSMTSTSTNNIGKSNSKSNSNSSNFLDHLNEFQIRSIISKIDNSSSNNNNNNKLVSPFSELVEAASLQDKITISRVSSAPGVQCPIHPSTTTTAAATGGSFAPDAANGNIISTTTTSTTSPPPPQQNYTHGLSHLTDNVTTSTSKLSTQEVVDIIDKNVLPQQLQELELQQYLNAIPAPVAPQVSAQTVGSTGLCAARSTSSSSTGHYCYTDNNSQKSSHSSASSSTFSSSSPSATSSPLATATEMVLPLPQHHINTINSICNQQEVQLLPPPPVLPRQITPTMISPVAMAAATATNFRVTREPHEVQRKSYKNEKRYLVPKPIVVSWVGSDSDWTSPSAAAAAAAIADVTGEVDVSLASEDGSLLPESFQDALEGTKHKLINDDEKAASFSLIMRAVSGDAKFRLRFVVSYRMGERNFTEILYSLPFRVESNRKKAFTEKPLAHSIKPREGLASCGEEVWVWGAKFSDKGNVKVKFGDVFAVVTRSDTNILECTAPPRLDLKTTTTVPVQIGNAHPSKGILWAPEVLLYTYRVPEYIN